MTRSETHSIDEWLREFAERGRRGMMGRIFLTKEVEILIGIADEIERLEFELNAWEGWNATELAKRSGLARETEVTEPDWQPTALAISTVLHGKGGLNALVWYQARGLAEELAKVVTDPARVAELSKPEALEQAIRNRTEE